MGNNPPTPAQCEANNNVATCYWTFNTYADAFNNFLNLNSDAKSHIKDIIQCQPTFKQYQIEVAAYTDSLWAPIGIAMTVFGAFIFICFFGSMYLCCCYKKGKGNDQQTGQQMSGMNSPQYVSKV